MQGFFQYARWDASATAEDGSTRETVRVLHIEDEPTEALLLREMLDEDASLRFVVKAVARLRDGLAALQRESFDVVLLDLSLPDATDLGGVQQMALAATGIPVIVFTGLANDSSAIQSMQCGAQDYLVKSQTDAELLVRAIRYAIERKRADEQMAWLARHDPLTGLANRNTFREVLAHAISRAHRDGSRVALLFVDLDHFKSVNDTLGHEVGDRLLQAVAGRLKGAVRDSDTVARLGGDEFTVILEALDDPSAATRVAEKIRECLSRPIKLGEADACVTPSIGVAVYPDSATDIDTLLRVADSAMYQVKNTGRNSVHHSGDQGREGRHRSHAMGLQLAHALERDEFKVQYQPKVELSTGRIIGAEALLRWYSGDLGLVGPGDFIPLAEQSGQIHRIGEFILRQACLQSAQWRRHGLPPIPVAVNVSAKQLCGCDFPTLVGRVLDDSALHPDGLEIEITESVLISDVLACRDMLERLKNMGVRVGVDDFGTGYSSLANLKRLPLDVLKIDKSFIRDLVDSADDAAIVEAIIALGRSLRLDVVAEGVETVGQRDFLHARGCRCAQGFLYCAALDAHGFAELLRTGRVNSGAAGSRGPHLTSVPRLQS